MARVERLAGVGLASALALTACRRTPPPADQASASSADAASEAAATSSGAPATEAVRPSRCHPEGPGLAIGHGVAVADLEIGDAVPCASGFAVAINHRTAHGRTAAVTFLGSDASGPSRIVELGPTLGDAPPPRLVRRDHEVVAVAYSRSPARAGDGAAEHHFLRELAVTRIPDDGEPLEPARVAQPSGDSLSFDVALASGSGPRGGVLVWDEASAAGRGAIRLAPMAPDGHVGPPHDVSPATTDAEWPRVVATGAGFVVFWLARRPDTATEDAGAVEVTGEARDYGWIEYVAVDAQGLARSGPRPITAATGRVSTYDVAALAGAAQPTVLVVARDDGESVDGSGGALLRVRLVGDTSEPAVGLPSDGLGRGGPLLIDGLASPPWVSWVGTNEQLRLLPLDESGAPSAAPSLEDAMSEARPLLRWAGANGVARLLLASPLDPDAQVRLFACTP